MAAHGADSRGGTRGGVPRDDVRATAAMTGVPDGGIGRHWDATDMTDDALGWPATAGVTSASNGHGGAAARPIRYIRKMPRRIAARLIAARRFASLHIIRSAEGVSARRSTLL